MCSWFYLHDETDLGQVRTRLAAAGQQIEDTIPGAEPADDQPFRLTSLAFKRSRDAVLQHRITTALRAGGLDVTINNLWILGWIGGYDKLSMARRIMRRVYGIDVEQRPDEYCTRGTRRTTRPCSASSHTRSGSAP